MNPNVIDTADCFPTIFRLVEVLEALFNYKAQNVHRCFTPS